MARPVGMQVVSYTLKDITDDVGYLKALGEARTAEVQRDARIGQAEASMQARSERQCNTVLLFLSMYVLYI